MTESKLALTVSFALFCAALGGCSDNADPKIDPDTSVRELKGTVDLQSYALDNAVVIAQARSGHTVVAPIGARGEFLLKVPAAEAYRILIANSTRSGRYEVVSRVVWSQGLAGTVKTLSGSGSSGSESDSESSPDGAPEMDAVCSESRASAELPYDAKIPLGATYRLSDSFREKGALPAAILDVKSEGGTWRVAELLANAKFVVTQEDCDHQGNKDTGRDRVFVTWKNADGSTETDHLDMRYCVGDVAPSAMAEGGASSSTSTSSVPCDEDDAHVCKPSAVGESLPSKSCEGVEGEDGPVDELSTCPAGGSGAGSGTGSGTGNGTGEVGTGAGAPSTTSGSPGTEPAGGGASSGGSIATFGKSFIWVRVKPGSRGDLGILRPLGGGIGGASTTGTTSGTAGVPSGGGTGVPTAGGTSADGTGMGGGLGALGTVDAGGVCAISAECKVGLRCIASRCMIPLK